MQKVSFWKIWGFWGRFDPLLAPWDALRVFLKKCLYSAQVDMKIHFVAKFQENLMDGYPAISRTHGRTDGTDNYSPFPTKVGGLTTRESIKQNSFFSMIC